jgi:hypothetical protein
MQRTIKDIQQFGLKGQKVLKFTLYYAYIPVIIYLGIKTVNW